MRFGDGPESSNFEDRTGGGGGLNLGGGLGMLLPLVASRFGIVGIIDPWPGLLRTDPVWRRRNAWRRRRRWRASLLCQQEQRRFLTQVLGSTEQVWSQIFTQAGATYRPTTTGRLHQL